MKKYLALILCVVLVAFSFAACGTTDSTDQPSGDAAEPQVWKLAHSESTDTMYDMYAHHFADLISEKTNGAVKVEIYPVGSLGDTSSQTEMVMNNSIQLGIFASGDVGDMFPAVQALSLNYVFSDDDAVNAQVLTQGEATKALDEMFATKKLITYDWFTLGNMQWGTTKPIRNLDDFKGFKMRIMSSPIIAANYEALGAVPTPMAFTETYSGLQLKTVDGTEQPMNAMEEMAFYEVCDYITMSNHAQMASFMTMNEDFYNGLSDEYKAILEEIKPEMEEFALTTLKKVIEEKTATILEKKPELEIIELTDEQREEFIKASLPVRDRITEFGGAESADILKLLLADVEKFDK